MKNWFTKLKNIKDEKHYPGYINDLKTRILFIILPILIFQSVSWVDPILMPLTIGCGFFFVYFSYCLIHSGKEFKKFDKWIKRISITICLVVIVSCFVKYDSEVIEYRNSDGYRIQQGSHLNDSIPSSFMLYVDDTSKILKNKNLVCFHNGFWFLYVGHPADTNDFYIKVKKNKYFTGPRTYVSFIYNNEIFERNKTKFMTQK